MATPNVKGSALNARLGWVRRNHGDDGIHRLMAAVDPATRGALEEPILKASWYPFAVFIDLIESIDRVFGSGDLGLSLVLGRHAAEDNLPTIYRLFFKVGSPKWVLERATRLWDLHYDSGRMTLEEGVGNHADLRVTGFATPHRAHCLSVAGWTERSVEMSGGVNVRVVETECRTAGAPVCTLHVSWE